MVIVLFFSFIIFFSSAAIYANWYITGDYRMMHYLYRIWISALALISIYLMYIYPFFNFIH